MLENFGLDKWKLQFDSYLDALKDNSLYLGIAIAGLLAIAGGWYGYRHFAIQKEEAAHTILVDCLAQAEQAVQGKAQWADVATMCQAGYEKFSGTKVASYILAVQIDALLADHKQPEALEKLELMLARIAHSSPLYPLYALKRALLKMDMPDAALKETGFKELQQLAADTHNMYNDAAQYYVGLQYQSQGDLQKAAEAWKPLVAINDTVTDAIGRSPWATLAQEKMNGLV